MNGRGKVVGKERGIKKRRCKDNRGEIGGDEGR